MSRVVYEVSHHELEGHWLVHRCGIPFSVHETQKDAIAAAQEHARAEHHAEDRCCQVKWKGGEQFFGRDADAA